MGREGPGYVVLGLIESKQQPPEGPAVPEHMKQAADRFRRLFKPVPQSEEEALPDPDYFSAAEPPEGQPAERPVDRAIRRALDHFAGVEATWREELKSGPKATAWRARAEGHIVEAHDAQVFLREIAEAMKP